MCFFYRSRRTEKIPLNNQEMNENIELPEEQEPLLIGKDTNGKIVIQKGKQKIIVHAWEIKLLKKIVFCITEE